MDPKRDSGEYDGTRTVVDGASDAPAGGGDEDAEDKPTALWAPAVSIFDGDHRARPPRSATSDAAPPRSATGDAATPRSAAVPVGPLDPHVTAGGVARPVTRSAPLAPAPTTEEIADDEADDAAEAHDHAHAHAHAHDTMPGYYAASSAHDTAPGVSTLVYGIAPVDEAQGARRAQVVDQQEAAEDSGELEEETTDIISGEFAARDALVGQHLDDVAAAEAEARRLLADSVEVTGEEGEAARRLAEHERVNRDSDPSLTMIVPHLPRLNRECRVCGRKVAAPERPRFRGPLHSDRGFRCDSCGNTVCAAHVQRVSSLFASLWHGGRFRCVLCLPEAYPPGHRRK